MRQILIITCLLSLLPYVGHAQVVKLSDMLTSDNPNVSTYKLVKIINEETETEVDLPNRFQCVYLTFENDKSICRICDKFGNPIVYSPDQHSYEEETFRRTKKKTFSGRLIMNSAYPLEYYMYKTPYKVIGYNYYEHNNQNNKLQRFVSHQKPCGRSLSVSSTQLSQTSGIIYEHDVFLFFSNDYQRLNVYSNDVNGLFPSLDEKGKFIYVYELIIKDRTEKKENNIEHIW